MNACCCSLPRSCCETCQNANWIGDDPLPPEPKSLGEMTVNIKINKDEILRELKEIRKAAEEVAKLLEALKLDQQPVYPYVPVWPYPGNWTITCGGGGTHQ